MGPPHDLGDRVDRPYRVRRPADSDQPGPRPEQRVEIGRVEGAIVETRLPRPDGEPALRGDPEPRIDIAVVVETGDDDLVSRVHRRGDRTADVERQARHVGTELDLRSVRCAEHLGHRFVGSGDDCIAPGARQERAIGIGVRRPVVARHGVDDRLRDLGAAGPVEEGDRTAVLLDRQGGKAAPQRLDVKAGHGVLGWRWAPILAEIKPARWT